MQGFKNVADAGGDGVGRGRGAINGCLILEFEKWVMFGGYGIGRFIINF